jgi:hypothetical protein
MSGDDPTISSNPRFDFTNSYEPHDPRFEPPIGFEAHRTTSYDFVGLPEARPTPYMVLLVPCDGPMSDLCIFVQHGLCI